jgi:hypothetical protein
MMKQVSQNNGYGLSSIFWPPGGYYSDQTFLPVQLFNSGASLLPIYGSPGMVVAPLVVVGATG